jgi:uncharacterized damage-inducible protein DinB
MQDHFRMFAAYNAWANRLLYAEAAKLDDAAFRQDTGAFFGSLHGTLNHLLATDRIWLRRMTGTGDAPTTLDVILFEDLAGLQAARRAEDDRILSFVEGLDDEALKEDFTYTPVTNPVKMTHALAPALSHLFNHQTHHRGQCHAILTMLGGPSLPLDLLFFLRGEGKRWL